MDSGCDIVNITSGVLYHSHHRIWVVLMLNAGHFAGAVFMGDKILVHKTFHKYVVRAKRGTVQSINDHSKGGSVAK